MKKMDFSETIIIAACDLKLIDLMNLKIGEY